MRRRCDLALGLTGVAATRHRRRTTSTAGTIARDPDAAGHGRPDARPAPRRRINDVQALWDGNAASRHQAPPMHRSTAGPTRDFDYNLDGLSHYGMLPDMLQDLKNVGLPPAVMGNVLPVRRGLRRGLGAERPERGEDPAPHDRGALMPAWYVHIAAAAETMQRLKDGVPPARRSRRPRRTTCSPPPTTTATTSRPGARARPVLPAAGLQGRHGQGPARARGVRADDLEGAGRQLRRPVGAVDDPGARRPEPARQQHHRAACSARSARC